MKSNFTFFFVTALLVANSLQISSKNEKSGVKITIDLDKTYQTFQGFGVFAGPPEFLYSLSKREEIIDALFGENGLQLSVLRTRQPANLTSEAEFRNSNQIWILKRVKEKYGVNRIISSAWSPPYDWKVRKGEHGGKNFNYLKAEHYQDYANYMANYVKMHEKFGLKLYAISPQNEPEFPTPDWDGCIWLPHQTAKFVKNYLKPTFKNQSIDTKIIIGETGNWNLANVYLSATSFMLNNEDFDIYASHGYSTPKLPNFKYVSYNQHVYPWFSKALYKKERWITEASATDAYDGSMKKGIQLADSLTQFLTVGDVNGFAFWDAVVGTDINEGLIVAKHESLIFPRVYHVYGQFTRFIKEGHIRVNAGKSWFSSSDIKVVAFKDEKRKTFTVVLTNKGKKDKICEIQFPKQTIENKTLEAVLTNDEKFWSPTILEMKSTHELIILVPSLSVTTVTGKIHYVEE